MVERVALVNITLPAKDKRRVFKPASRFWTLSTMAPRYFPRLGVEQNSKILQSSSLVFEPTLGEKNARDFSTLTFYPNRLQKVSRTSLIALQFLPSAFANSTRSSTKNRWENLHLL